MLQLHIDIAVEKLSSETK